MKAIIMAGGFGTRLKPLTDNLPKPMVPIIDKPVLEHIILHLKKFGYTDISLTLGYRPFDIINYFSDGEEFGVSLQYFVEREPLGTAGSVKNAVDFEGDFLVISGDALTNIDLEKFRDAHLRSRRMITMAVKEYENPKGFGIVHADDAGNVLEFAEKPDYVIEKGLVNTGIYMMHTDILQYIPNGYFDFSKNLFPKVLKQIRVYPMQEYWSDIGTLESYYLTNRDVATDPLAFGVRI